MRDKWLWAGTIAYAALFTALGALKYAVHRNLVDFGIFAQTAASAFGCFCNTIEGSHWSFHSSPILYVVGAAVSVWHSSLALVALQAIAGALVAPPVYGLVMRARGDAGLARFAAVVVWLYPPLAGLIFGDFHENGFAPAAIAWMLYCFDGGMLLWAAVAAAVALAVKEDQAVFLTIAGGLGWLRFRGTTPGRLALGIGLVSCVVAVHFFTAGQSHAIVAGVGDTHWQPVRFYSWTGADFGDLLRSGLLGRAGFVVLAFLPLLFLPFRSRMMWLAAAPLAEVLLSRMPTTYTLGTHYAGAWLGYVLVAFAFALRDLDARRARTAAFWCMGLCVVELVAANPMHPGLNLHAVAVRDRALDDYLRTLPANLDVATQEEAYTHLALDDPRATVLPETSDVVPASCYILLDRDYPASARLEEYGPAVGELARKKTYVLIDRKGAIELYWKTGDGCR
ncbi:MAG TPA: DUF2079 domain-containing protein [Candidatus Acidoferrales bacterium]|nr:DUF2079 domain-containing protein [Candidatus Acidoferrales bacterium]